MTAVYHNGTYLREVSPAMLAADVAGRCLPPVGGMWRAAERIRGDWHVRYFKPTDIDEAEWARRPTETYARMVQPTYAHG